MEKIEIGDVVGRKSYNKDILFRVKNIIQTADSKIAILIGIIERVEADSALDDLEKITQERINKDLNHIQLKVENKIDKLNLISKNKEKNMVTGKILHLDGDSCLDNKNSLLA